MKDLKEIVIETERLKLVPLSMKYKQEIFKEFNPEITSFILSSPSKDISETEDSIRRNLKKREAGKNLRQVITLEENDEFLGIIEIGDLDKDIPVLGIWVKKSAHGKGYGKEAIHEIKKWADENLKYENISYPCAAENLVSRKIPESLGGKVIAEWEMEFQGIKRPTVEYHIPR